MHKLSKEKVDYILEICKKDKLEQGEMEEVIRQYIHVRKGVKIPPIKLRSVGGLIDPIFIHDFRMMDAAYNVAVGWFTNKENDKLWKIS